jgi:hypothetical protein
MMKVCICVYDEEMFQWNPCYAKHSLKKFLSYESVDAHFYHETHLSSNSFALHSPNYNNINFHVNTPINNSDINMCNYEL